MAKEVLKFQADLGCEQVCSQQITTTKFNDGYEIRQPNGLNSLVKKWSPTFTVTELKLDELRNFLKRHGKVHSFYWVDPLNEKDLYVVDDDFKSKQIDFGIYQINVNLRQVFEVVDE